LPAGRIRSGLGVEIFLNVAWVALAIFLVAAWLRFGSSTSHHRHVQLIAIAVLIAILFPVISVSDDLMAIQNPAETDNCQRRDHLVPGTGHVLLASAAAEPPSIFGGIAFGFLQYVSLRKDPPRVADRPALASIANRPPPVA
jgi:hypothetical protein